MKSTAFVFALAVVLCISRLSAYADTQIGRGFDGPTGQDTFWWPNDPNAAVGPNHIVQIINGLYRVYDKNGTLLLNRHIDELFTNINPSVATLDPNITYDDIAGRWIIEANGSGTDITNAYLAVSDASNPLQGFTEVHAVSFPGANDGSKAGFNADVVVINATSGTAVIDKSTLLDSNKATFKITYRTTNTYGRAARMHGAATGTPMYWMSDSGGQLRVTRMTNVLSATPTITSFNIAGSSGATDPATPAWRNNSLVTADTGDTYWWQVNTATPTPTLVQQGLIAAPSGYVHGYGSAGIAPNGDMGVSYMEYSADTNALPVRMFVAWRAASDPTNTMRTPLLVADSLPTVQANDRHGDFSSTVSDIDTNGATLNTFWSCNGYIKSASGGGLTEASWNQNFGGTLTAPTILTPPKNQVVFAGSAAQFTVQAGGASPFNFQWLKNNTPVSGATNASYLITSTTTNDTGNYSVRVTNSFGRIFSVTATLAVVGPLTPTGDWRLDDGAGNIARDSSVFGYDGTLAGAGAVWTNGFSGSAIQFNGTSNWVALGMGPSVSGTNDFTVAAWIKTTAATASVVIQQRDAGYNGEYQLGLNANGTVHFFLYGNSAYQFDFSTASAVNNGAWHYLTATRSGTNGSIYIDGALAASTNGTVRSLDATISTAVGRDIRDNSANFNGLIDEVRLYKTTALLSTDVTNLYNAYLAPPSAATPLFALPANNQLIISWTNANRWVLLQNSNLANSAGWTTNNTIAASNGLRFITVTNLSGRMFYRLKQ